MAASPKSSNLANNKKGSTTEVSQAKPTVKSDTVLQSEINLQDQNITDSQKAIQAQTSFDKPLAPLTDMRPATLDKIERAVRQLFAGNDAHEVTMIQIAKTANVSLQTLYKYFGDKQTVFNIIMDRVLGRLALRMMDHLQGIDSVKDRLRKTLWVCFDFVDKHPDAVMVLSAVSTSSIRNIAIYEKKELIDAFLSVLADGQERGELNNDVPLFILFDVFMGFVNRIGLMHIIRQRNKPIADNFDALFLILWRAMEKPEN